MIRSILLRNDLRGNIINVSKYSFTKGQDNLLNRNLNFCPTTGYYKKEELKRDTKRFTKKIKLRGHFCDNNENKQIDQIVTEPVIKCKPNWEPKKNITLLKVMSKIFSKRRKNFREITSLKVIKLQ